MPDTATKPDLASAVVMMRDDDDAVLLVRHPDHAEPGPFDGRWSLPMTAVAGAESAEDTVVRVLRDQLHVEPGPLEFNDTLYMQGAGGTRFVVNAFLAVGWEGEPRFSARDYADAAWVQPGGTLELDGALADGVAEWFARVFERPETERTPEAMLATLEEARRGLLAAFEAIPLRQRVEALDDGWTPLDVLAHAADVETYYTSETRQILSVAGHAWRSFNDAQWNEARELRQRAGAAETEDAVCARLELARSDTRMFVGGLEPRHLEAYGNHPERGVVQVGDRIDKIARHDREHTEQLRTMERTARMAAASQET